ncbi:MAG: RsiV family protein [Pseudoflavonifractor sp.]|nr:RsiV family protein [Alloprevotella sp.]MCM1116134.1 RsiV family protein [Pseudoflavonifractor sp.]
MNKTLTALLSAAAIAALALTACGKTDSDNGAKADCDASSATASRDGIESIDLKTTLMSSTRAFSFTTDGAPCYLTITAVAEWPRQIGKTDLSALRDTLIAAAFPSQKGKQIEDAITGFVTSPTPYTSSATTDINVTDVPNSTTSWIVTSHIRRTALTTKYATYTADTYSYLGGAHPNTVATPVTLDLATGTIVTPATLFKPGSDKAIIEAVTNNLALQLAADPAKLTQGGLLTDTLPMPKAMYIDGDGQVVFRYPPYEIAPYSMGAITVPVTPYQLRDILTPQGQALLE